MTALCRDIMNHTEENSRFAYKWEHEPLTVWIDEITIGRVFAGAASRLYKHFQAHAAV